MAKCNVLTGSAVTGLRVMHIWTCCKGTQIIVGCGGFCQCTGMWCSLLDCHSCL